MKKDDKSINVLPAHQGPSVQVSDIQGPRGNTNPALPATTNSPLHRQGYMASPDGVVVAGELRDYDHPAVGGSEVRTDDGSDSPYLSGDTADSYPGPGDPAQGRTARGAADGGLPGFVFGSGAPNDGRAATSGRTARGAADGGNPLYPFNGTGS